MTYPDCNEVLESYLRGLDGNLPLGRADRLDVVDECRDHLISHTEWLVGEGASPEAATESAIAQFGTNASVAAGIRREFLRRSLRRLSGLLLLYGSALGLCWRAVVAFGPAAPWGDHAQPAAVATFDAVGDWTALGAVVVAALSFALLVLPCRLSVLVGVRASWQLWARRGCLAAVLLGTAALAHTICYVVARAAINPHSLAWPAVTGAAVLTAAGAVLMVPSLRTVTVLR